jgi:hypothetical protein
MAFDIRSLKTDGYQAGPNMTHGYNTADSQATVAGAGYFNAATRYLRVGDGIRVSGGQGGTMVTHHYTVTANTGTVVTVVRDAIT